MSRTRTSAIRTTIVGGLLFLIPFILVVAVVGKAHQVMRAVAKPIAEQFGVDHIGFVAMIDVIALLVTLVLCYAAGLIAVSERGRRAYRALDERLLDLVPRYGFVKAMASGVAREKLEHMKIVTVRFDDLSQVAFEIERDADVVVVFLPGSPDPWSGTVCYVTPDRVVAIDADVQAVLKMLRSGGRGGLAVLTGSAAGAGN